MFLRKIQDDSYEGKNVLMRVDFNVVLKDGDIAERYKVESAKKSIEYLLAHKARTVTLVTHLGRPDGKVNPEFSLKNILDDISRVLGYEAVFVKEVSREEIRKVLYSIPDSSILLLENIRFFAGEEKNDAEFAKMLARSFDVFVNDAFSVCHRDQASVTRVTEFLPSFAGLHLQEEVEHLSRVAIHPDRPAVAVIGGAKIETKLPLLRKFEKEYDVVLVGGKIANEAIDGDFQFSDHVMFPKDFVGDRLDIGLETQASFMEKIRTAGTIVWNGPMGMFEDVRYREGTQKIAQAIAQSSAYSVVGGGESVQALEEMGLMKNISFVSTGGGAMLDFLSGERMPGLEALQVHKDESS
jgi:phosphoglycerate kinase